MCDFMEGFKLCTCKHESTPSIHHKKSKRRKRHQAIPLEITWTLYQYLGKKNHTLDGMAEIPSQILAQQLTVDFVQSQLNQANCFDFDYQPNEGDCLTLRHSGSGFLSFIFRETKWTIDSYDPFMDATQKILAGKMAKP